MIFFQIKKSKNVRPSLKAIKKMAALTFESFDMRRSAKFGHMTPPYWYDVISFSANPMRTILLWLLLEVGIEVTFKN